MNDINGIIETWKERAERYETLSEPEKQAIADEERRREEVARARDVELRLLEVVPPRYRDAVLADTELQAHLAAALDETQSPEKEGLLLTGPTGTGKTHTLFGLIRAGLHINPTVSVEYHPLPLLLAHLRPDGGADAGVLRRLTQVKLLVLDDLGAAKHSEWVEDVLFQIIDTRYQWRRPTLYGTNVPAAQLGSRIGDRLASRIAETCRVQVVKGPDRRRVPSIARGET